MDEAAPAEMHAMLFFALAPERDGDVADAHRLGDPAPHASSQLRPHRRLAAARFAGDQQALDGRGGDVDAALCGPFGEVERVGRRQRDRLSA